MRVRVRTRSARTGRIRTDREISGSFLPLLLTGPLPERLHNESGRASRAKLFDIDHKVVQIRVRHVVMEVAADELASTAIGLLDEPFGLLVA